MIIRVGKQLLSLLLCSIICTQVCAQQGTVNLPLRQGEWSTDEKCRTETPFADTIIVNGDNTRLRNHIGFFSDSLKLVETINEAMVPSASIIKNNYWAVSTNMLYYLALLPNIAAEYHFANSWSLKAGWAYNWLWNDNAHAYWRLYGGGMEVRKWFGKIAQEKPLQGHHLGFFVQAGTYDVEFGNVGNLSYFSYCAGLSYGYSLPITRRLNIDFGFGFGYCGGEYKEYLPIDECYVWQADKRRHYFGPTTAEVSLIWLLGRGNVNKDKGGR